MKYGIVADCWAPREDRGAPAFIDGWYDDLSIAREAQEIMRAKNPDAEVSIVYKLEG